MLLLVLLAIHGSTDSNLDEIRKAFREGKHADVVSFAERALAAPGESGESRGEILFWKGTSLVRLGRHAEAVAAIDEARGLGFTPSELHLERALALHTLGRQEEADRSFREAERLAQDDPDRLAELRRRWREGTRSVEVRVTGLVGYDSNLFLISDDVRLAEDVTRESFYYGAILSARAVLADEPYLRFYLDYQNSLRGYVDDFDFSYSDNLLSGVLSTRLARLDWLSAELGAYVGEAFVVRGGHFRTQRGIEAALLLHPSESWELRLGADARGVQYYDDVPAAQSRDGTLTHVEISLDWDLGSGWKAAPYAGYGYWDTEGSDYERGEWEIGLSATAPEILGLRTTLTAGYVRADFRNPHTLTALTRRRADDRILVRLQVAFPGLTRSWGVSPSFSLTYEHWRSNIPAWDFDRWDLTPSVELLALSF